MCRPPSSDRVRRRACGLPYPAFGRRSRPSVALHVCFLTGAPGAGDPATARRFTRPSPPRRRPIVQRCPTGAGGRRWFPGPSSGGQWPLHFPGRAPTYPPPAVLGAPLPAMLIVRRHRWSPVIGREWRRVRPVTPPSRPRRRSNSVHAGKSTYSGEIDYRFLTFQTGSRF